MTLTEAFENQAVSCNRLGSPFMGRLFTLLAASWPEQGRLAARFDRFTGDIGPAGASLPLRIAGGLHALVLSGRAPELAEVYPPHAASDTALSSAALATMAAEEDFLLEWIDSAPQTNEVRRSAALMAGAATLKSRIDRPVFLSELGASAGLNLMWDHFAMQLPGARIGAQSPALTLTPAWDGPLPPTELPQITARAGADLNPLNPADPDDLLRLTAFLWPDQPERLALTRAAAAVMTAPIARGDAIDWLEHRLQEAPKGQTHLIQHTIAWQYFPPGMQAQGRALIEAAGAAATEDRPLAWLSLETDGDKRGLSGAPLTLRFWPGDITLDLGRADFHGRWIKWAGKC